MTTEASEKPCCDTEIHSGHMCELESQQDWDTIRKITDKPNIKCGNCGAQVNSHRNVCMPTEL